MFRKIRGQDQALTVLKHAIRTGKIGQAYLFHGPEGVGKFTTALYFAMALNCVSSEEAKPCGICSSCRKFLQFSHPDFIYLFPTPNMELTKEGEIKGSKHLTEYQAYIANKMETPWKQYFFSAKTEIRMDAIEHLQYRLSMSMNEAHYRICVIENADAMNSNATNAFLKTLEEPPANTVIILTTTQQASLLPTIISRCQLLRFHALPNHVVEKELEEIVYADKVEAKTYARLANGNLKTALRMFHEGKNEVRAFMIHLFEIIVARDDLAFLSLLSDTKGSRSSDFYDELINHITVLISDIIFFKTAPDFVVNIDILSLFEEAYRHNPTLDEAIATLLEDMEKMHFRLSVNVNSQLVLTGIYNSLKCKIHPHDC